eukprot:scaffold120847_cov44-Tisochrysis_lutea.AAC.1
MRRDITRQLCVPHIRNVPPRGLWATHMHSPARSRNWHDIPAACLCLLPSTVRKVHCQGLTMPAR